MADQNTDRMWWVIGAIAIGSAIFFIAKKGFPELFNKVFDSLTNMLPTELGMNAVNHATTMFSTFSSFL